MTATGPNISCFHRYIKLSRKPCSSFSKSDEVPHFRIDVRGSLNRLFFKKVDWSWWYKFNDHPTVRSSAHWTSCVNSWKTIFSLKFYPRTLKTWRTWRLCELHTWHPTSCLGRNCDSISVFLTEGSHSTFSLLEEILSNMFWKLGHFYMPILSMYYV